MRQIRKNIWDLPDSATTSESAWLNRRALIAAMGFGAVSAISPRALAATNWNEAAKPAQFADAGRPVTPEEINGSYNNFYEFGGSKSIASAAEALNTDGWTVKVDGLVDTPMTLNTDDLISRFGLEERVYRHRCVEAWSMVAPWLGVPLEKVVRAAGPRSDAKYVRFESFLDPDMARGQRQSWYPWPYIEGLTVAEAMNPLPLLVVGAYGKVLGNQFGAPVRLHLPWKYGFKSVKSITRISFVKERPVSFWEDLQKSEYGFWANVNPEVAHPRWSQATERDIGTGDRIPTELFNGYGEMVASLYDNNPEAKAAGERLWR